jgi:hypothetical protein
MDRHCNGGKQECLKYPALRAEQYNSPYRAKNKPPLEVVAGD